MKIIVNSIWFVINRRSDTQDEKTPVILAIDEFTKIDGELINDILEQGRSQGISLLLANQNLEQIEDKMLQNLLANTHVKMIGIMADEEAEKLGKAIDPESKYDFTNNIKKGEVGRWMVFYARPEGGRDYYELKLRDGICKTCAENE